jgi:hypothetical protein
MTQPEQEHRSPIVMRLMVAGLSKSTAPAGAQKAGPLERCPAPFLESAISLTMSTRQTYRACDRDAFECFGRVHGFPRARTTRPEDL